MFSCDHFWINDLVVDGSLTPQVLKDNGIFHIRGSITAYQTEGSALVRLWPETMVIFDEGIIARSLDKAGEFFICPKCFYFWKKRTHHPTQCPECHKRLKNIPLAKLNLAKFMKAGGSKVYITDYRDENPDKIEAEEENSQSSRPKGG
jgi:predicted Zn-ribbon and HTH transcriptional regulator